MVKTHEGKTYCRLAAAGFADEGNGLAWREIERNAAHGIDDSRAP